MLTRDVFIVIVDYFGWVSIFLFLVVLVGWEERPSWHLKLFYLNIYLHLSLKNLIFISLTMRLLLSFLKPIVPFYFSLSPKPSRFEDIHTALCNVRLSLLISTAAYIRILGAIQKFWAPIWQMQSTQDNSETKIVCTEERQKEKKVPIHVDKDWETYIKIKIVSRWWN